MSVKPETLRKVVSDPAARRTLSLHSPVFFDSFYCGMRYAPHRERWLQSMLRLYTSAQATIGTPTPQKARLLLLAPRDHGKTEAVITLCTMLVATNRNIRILLIGETQGMARKRLARIKDLLTSPRVRTDWCSAPEDGFGPFKTDEHQRTADQALTWGASQIRVQRTLHSVDPTVEAVGLGGAVTGGHFDVIIIDDPQNHLNVRSPAERQKHRDWHGQTVGPMLSAGGMEIVVGTRKHADDLYAHMLHDPTYRVIEDKAVKTWPETFEPVFGRDDMGRRIVEGWDVTGHPEVLWPEERPFELLMNERAREDLGPRGFQMEYQNEVVDDSTALFSTAVLDAAKDKRTTLYRGPWPEQMLVVQGWDPAFVVDRKHAEMRDTDYSVGVTWGVDLTTRKRYLMGLYRARGETFQDKRQAVINEYQWFGPPADVAPGWSEVVENGWCCGVSMERNSAGEFYRLAIEEESDLPITPHWTGRNKVDPYEGVPSIATLFEQGKVVLPYGDLTSRTQVDELVAEFHGLGVAAHDDILLAVWIAETLLRKKLAQWETHVTEARERVKWGLDKTTDTPAGEPNSAGRFDGLEALVSRMDGVSGPLLD